MIRNNLIINFFFFLICASPQLSYALDAPKPKARPEVRLAAFQDVFDQIKKQNWSMAIVLANDYENSNLSSYVKWLDITRPGSNHTFDYLKIFIQNTNIGHIQKNFKKIESSINDSVNNSKVLSWYNSNPPQTAKGKIDFLEALVDSGVTINKKKRIVDIWINSDLTYKQQKYFIRKYSKFWNQNDNWKRFERLIYEGKNISARRTLNRIKGDYRKLGEARLGLSRRTGNVSQLIKNVPQN